ncbi:urea active transporter 1 like protein [Verticillium longisporum]|uniref:Urea active transporter 1 like protein n=1 Tax=Verticillium longisporum TaxID=100787 RepID=A0A8I2ZPS0_VERLO|nr:urea active transporter 1 like protein [Verticillium longisporum]
MSSPILHQGVGYGLIVGLSVLFAGFMIVITWSLKRYNSERQTSEMFTTAGRTLKSGLVASSVLSTWTWAATLLQSSGVAYRYGVSGPFWYAAGATVQIILFATLAIELKRKAPNAHTFLEVVRARYGPVTHFVFIVFCCFTNILVTAMLLTGGAAVIENLTGAPTAATVFIFPLGVVVYTLFGGIKATFITDYVNALVILVIIFIFAFVVYATNGILGSPGAVWDILQEISKERPISGNAGGSYLTMRSQGGAEFFVINIVGNFGTVFLDNGYYNKAISASPVDALPGYVMGGLSWFAVPWLTATTMGLAGLALERYDVWPTYPNRLTDAEVTAGLVLPNAAVALLGKGGAVATLLLAFMAIMSTYSSELIAISSIYSYDIYKTYINPAATGKQIMRMNYIGMTVFALFMGAFSTALYYIGISMGYLYVLMGVTSGEITVATSGANTPMLVGNVIALLSPLVFIPLLTYMPPFKPQHYDWQSMLNIRQGSDEEDEALDAETAPHEHAVENAAAAAAAAEEERAKLDKSAKFARWLCVGLTLAFLVLWPMPLFGTAYVFSRKFFTGWVVVGILWLFVSSGIVVFLPLFESRRTIARTSKSMFRDVMGLRRRGRGGAEVVVQGRHMAGDVTPPVSEGEMTEKAGGKQ